MDKNKIIDSLHLLYFEYDIYQNKFIKDKTANKDTVYSEFIKLTYELSRNDIQFFIDENSDIVISDKDNIIEHVKQRVKNLKYHFESKSKNIYVLSDKYIEYAKNIPIINTIIIKKNINLEKYDAIVFTSKNGVSHIDSITEQWKSIPSYAISTQTAKEIKNLGGNLKFIGKEKHGNEFAYELLDLLKEKKVAYLGAKDIVSNLVSILKNNGIDCDYIPVYETMCVEYKEKIDLPNDSIIIFSSPSTIKCFLSNVNWKESFQAISIGKTTEKFFPENIKPILSDNTTLKSCVQKAISLERS